MTAQRLRREEGVEPAPPARLLFRPTFVASLPVGRAGFAGIGGYRPLRRSTTGAKASMTSADSVM